MTPTPCAVGTYGPVLGADDSTDCKACPLNKICNVAGLAAPLSTCPAGKYCDKLAITAAEIATKNCGAGHYCPGSTKVEKPIKTSQKGKLCSSQFYCPTGTLTELSCPAGYYDDRKGLSVCQ